MFTQRNSCRLCGASALKPVLNLGEQALAGVFPTAETLATVPVAPLELVRCPYCGLAQLAHTVAPSLLFHDYYYRSGISTTMRNHLASIAAEAKALHPGAHRVLDIGCNDGTLLRAFEPGYERIGIDPSDVTREAAAGSKDKITYINGFFPQAAPSGPFDLIFSVACFYDLEDPIAFAKAVRSRLDPWGLWCVEVAYLPKMLENVGFDAICHEHVTYWSLLTLDVLAKSVGMQIVHCDFNNCNGGSVRCYLAHDNGKRGSVMTTDILLRDEQDKEKRLGLRGDPPVVYDHFRSRVFRCLAQLAEFFEARLRDKRPIGEAVHVLGASTKGNVLLQFAGVGDYLKYASDRDPRKVGRYTPGTGLKIVSEEESRAMRPDYYLVLPWHFRDEIVVREHDAIENGVKLLFPLPHFSLVSKERLHV